MKKPEVKTLVSEAHARGEADGRAAERRALIGYLAGLVTTIRGEYPNGSAYHVEWRAVATWIVRLADAIARGEHVKVSP